MASSASALLEELGLSSVLTERVRVLSAPADKPWDPSTDATSSFVLYLPTVVLRKQHNPAFALACHLANHLNVPLLVLCTVLDDAHHNVAPKCPDGHGLPVVGTARRLCFQLQVLQKACPAWQDHGAAVAVRVHGPTASRRPHHLTLSRQAAAVVVDEPFVQPYRSYVQSIVQATARVCFGVDGSTTVPPVRRLRALPDGTFTGVPPKAWMWKEKIKGDLARHVRGVVEEGALDAPSLRASLHATCCWSDPQNPLCNVVPKEWKDSTVAAPGERAWTVPELVATDPSSWSLQWPGIDTSVRPCRQTHGAHGWERWKTFQRNHLASYQNKRNNIKLPHAVSRLSCYLNCGSVSIFQIVHELWQDRRNTYKFEDEIIKWREISYAHAFCTPDYFSVSALPKWSSEYLGRVPSGGNGNFPLEDLCLSRTPDATWNAMQTYLRETGELHNNARMTWGKTVVHWQKSLSPETLLEHMACLNDRYALDGLSPPSYAGLLWCLGWCDKPWSGGSISTKPASRYRVGPEGFREAQRLVMQVDPTVSIVQQKLVRQRQLSDDDDASTSTSKTPASSPTRTNKSAEKQESGTKRRRTIDSYFTPIKSPKKRG